MSGRHMDLLESNDWTAKDRSFSRYFVKRLIMIGLTDTSIKIRDLYLYIGMTFGFDFCK